MTEVVLLVAVLTLMYHVAGDGWFIGFSVAYLVAIFVDAARGVYE